MTFKSIVDDFVITHSSLYGISIDELYDHICLCLGLSVDIFDESFFDLLEIYCIHNNISYR